MAEKDTPALPRQGDADNPAPPTATTTTTTTTTTADHDTLKYSLLGPSLTKAGQDSVDQTKVSEIIYNASKGSKFFNREEAKDQILTKKIATIIAKKQRLEKLDLSRELRHADQLIAQLEASRDLTQWVVHVDCDAFYAAVEQLDRPELKDVPFAVGGGVLTTCNYAARKFGCRSGMAGFVAKKLCPELLLIPLNFDKYTSKAQEVREVLAEYDPRFESASIDEAYLNITEYCKEHDLTPEETVQRMRDEVHERAKITVSAGIAANAKLAKICSNMNKPNGQFLLPNERRTIMAFMRDLPCRKVNGIGRVLERELAEVGVKTCGDIYSYRQYLRQMFGEKTYEFLITVHLGLGRTNVQPAEEYERKSVGTESTFRDMSDPAQIREKLKWTAEELEKDMRRAECKGRTLCLKVKLHTYEVFTRQVVTPKAIYQADDLYNYALPMLAKVEQEMAGMKLRLMGLRCTHLVSTKKPDTRAFFGLKPRRTESGDSTTELPAKRKASDHDGEWETWPEEALDGTDAELEASASALLGTERDDDHDENYRHHGKEIMPNPTPKKNTAAPAEEEEWWDCPICSRPQPADERQFNEHIDLCLSRQTIRDAVQRDAESISPVPRNNESSDANKRLKTGSSDKKRGRGPSTTAVDPKQKKLFFG
ncbi:putative DNA polymerase kappa [Seiridium cardinale]|uniref:DNA polymerase kappa n=1 Tax=Seiridium cardinale TaxID=138064 RepID=A0ABR2XUG2_9PEZI